MARHWKKLPTQERINHPLNGIKGWLLLFLISVGIAIARELGEIASGAAVSGRGVFEFLALDIAAIRFSRYAFTLEAIAAATILALAINRRSEFRVAASILLAGSWPVTAVLASIIPFPGAAEILARSFIGWILTCAIWIPYLNYSRRVRVTFEGLDLDIEKEEGNCTNQTAEARHQFGDAFADDDEKYFAEAGRELEEGNVDDGLWNRLLVENEGNERSTRLKYIAIRARRLKGLSAEASLPPQSDIMNVAPSEVPSTTTFADGGDFNRRRLFNFEPHATQSLIVEKVVVISAVLVIFFVIIVALEDSNRTGMERVGSSSEVDGNSAVVDDPGNANAPGTISHAADVDFMKRFPEWSTSERRALLQKRIDKIDLERQAKGEEPLSDTAVLEQARMQLADEGYR